MDETHTDFGTSEQEIFEELKIRNELEPISTHQEYLMVIEEIINEKIAFGEMDDDEDTEGIKDRLGKRFEELRSDTAFVPGDEMLKEHPIADLEDVDVNADDTFRDIKPEVAGLEE